jgi:hypothetical protein
MLLTEAERRLTKAGAAQPRPPIVAKKRIRPPRPRTFDQHLHGPAAHACNLRRELSHDGASMTERHACKPSTIKARFRDGVCRTSTLANVCTAETTSPRRRCGFRQLFCPTKPPPCLLLMEGVGGLSSCCGLAARRGLLAAPALRPAKPQAAPRDRQVATLFFLVAVATVSVALALLGPCPPAANITRPCGIAPLPTRPRSESRSELK